MSQLILKSTASHYGRPWSDADRDYVVLDGRHIICRIMLHPQAPKGCPWFCTITAMENPASIRNRGYSATREQAIVEFRAQWCSSGNLQTH
jgi:hypothetical protein